MRSIRYFFRRVARLIEYLPIIWRTHDWDFGYTLDILQYSLDRMSRSIRKYGHHVKADQDADDMAWAAEIIRRQIGDGDAYFGEATAEFEKKWGEPTTILLNVPGYPATKEMQDYYDEKIERHLQAEDEYREALLRAVDAEEKEWKELWRFISKHMRSWWD